MTTETKTDPKLAKRIATVQKLLNQSSCPGATAGESELFYRQAQVLIEKFNISEAMLDEEDNRKKGNEPIVKQIVFQRTKIDKYGNVVKIGNMPTWILTLSRGVSKANRCRHWYVSQRASRFSAARAYIEAAGTAANLKTFDLTMPFLVGEVDRLYQEEKPSWLNRSEGKRWGNSFRNGCATRIAQRLREARAEAAKAMKDDASVTQEDRYKLALADGDTEALLALDKEDPNKQQFALARIESALIRLDKDEARADEWVDTNMNLGKGTARNHYGSDSSAYSAGHAAGSRASINAPKGRIS